MASAAPDIPARLDRLPWSGWHNRIVVALGAAWVLDGLEVTLVGSLGAVLERHDTLGLDATQVGAAGSMYLGGAVLGALLFGRLADRLGRKRLFLATLAVYTLATLATAFATGYVSFALCRIATGLGIGGEYAAINSAIDELIPARVRGRVNLGINGSFWIGAALGAAASLVLLAWLGPARGWRAGFGLGALLAVAIIVVRRHVPESPRWLVVHGRGAEAEAVLAAIEHEAGVVPSPALPTAPAARRTTPSIARVVQVLLVTYRRRSIVGLALMISQAFFYNAIFFTHALVLTRFYGVPAERVAYYIFPFALGNVLGPLVLGPLFDGLGRRRMIVATYGVSGLGLALIGLAFHADAFSAATQALAWSAVFFVASAAASSAYLTVSETFPLEMRSLAIAVFYAIGTGAGGFAAPWLFGWLVESGRRDAVAAGYALGALLVLVAAALAWRHAVDAERRPLEEIAGPIE
ncbi:MAG: MFS transporter [Proteobacteria bacterium]|nr:MFS transporter [Pseudomonadota bacterium]